jgi:hypothetical protein
VGVYGIGNAPFLVTSRDNVKRRTLQAIGDAMVAIGERHAWPSLNSVCVVDAAVLRRRRRDPQQEIKKVKKDAIEQLKRNSQTNSPKRVEQNLAPEAREKLLAVLRADNTRRMRARFGDSWDSWDEPPVETPMESPRPGGAGRPDALEAEVQRPPPGVHDSRAERIGDLD